MKTLLCCVVGVATFITYSARVEAFNFSVEPSRIELSVPAGKQRGKTVRVNNKRLDQLTHIKVYVRDVVLLPDGTNDFPPSGSTAWSCANWVKVVPEEFDISPGKFSEVRVSIAVPEGMQGGYYAMLFFETTPSYVEKGIGVNFRIGAFVQVTIPGTEIRQARLADMVVPNPRSTELHIFNDGNVLVRPKGKLRVSDAQGKRIAQIEINPDNLGILPKTLRKFPMTLDVLPRGTYLLRAEIDYGSSSLLVGEREVTVQ